MPMLAILSLAACADTTVLELGANRYRATTDTAMTAGGAESASLAAAQAHCAARGQRAEATVASSSPHVMYRSYAGASVEFTCVPR
jgi:hypothetical protein